MTEKAEIVELTPEQKAELARKMETPIGDMPITMNTIVKLSEMPSIPDHYKGKPQDMLAAALVGRELGVGPMTAINNIDLIDGTISMRAKLMSGLILRQGHIIKTLEQTATRCALECHRYHRQTNQLIEVGVVEYTMEDAEAAGDARKGPYKKYPKAMLTNRALSLAARTFYGDVLGIGQYMSEEVGLSDDVDEIPADLLVDDSDAAEALVGAVLDAEVVEG